MPHTLIGLNPVPWQFDLLQRIERRDVDETFRGIVNPDRSGR